MKAPFASVLAGLALVAAAPQYPGDGDELQRWIPTPEDYHPFRCRWEPREEYCGTRNFCRQHQGEQEHWMEHAGFQECIDAHEKRPWLPGPPIESRDTIQRCFNFLRADESMCGSSTWCAFADAPNKGRHEYVDSDECLWAHELPSLEAGQQNI
ncbi:hypothetical protein OCS_04167 [Ophiocordyceps sinensis CO18]|uniref:Uncharacterized protein n=1 Tax=Ophiocordyceps sinensis (strain Co18 / CGMCC 3.14243) TaxID=911162 RepID=T5A3W1_OPHSC|nr:hypothetical protein OCS_04167 [Ophiocordyceps sinensis CO18]